VLPHRALASGLAASRTRSSSLGASMSALCPGRVSLSVFPLARSLPSTDSAAALAALFAGFLGTTDLSDFPDPFITGFGFPSSVRPRRNFSTGRSWISRFPRREVPHVHGVSDRAEPTPHSRYRVSSCCLAQTGSAEAPRTCSFRGSIPNPCVPLSTLRRRPRGRRRMTRGRRGSLLLRREALSSSPFCRFIPAH